jgi:hypothetical protein
VDFLPLIIGVLLLNTPAALTFCSWMVYLRHRRGLRRSRNLYVVANLLLLSASIAWWYAVPFVIGKVSSERSFQQYGHAVWPGIAMAVVALALALITSKFTIRIGRGSLPILIFFSAVGSLLLWATIGMY